MDEEDVRLYLQSSLESGFNGLNVYFRPPENLLLNYPCIVYEPKSLEASYANSVPYVIGTQFQVTLLSNLPGYSDARSALKMPGVVVNGHHTFVKEAVVHDVFTVSVNVI